MGNTSFAWRWLDLRSTPSRRRAVKLHLFAGYASTLLLVIQGIVLIPLYVDYFGERLYGFWLASGGILAWTGMLDVGAASITMQRCASAYGRGDLRAVAGYYKHGLLITGFVIVTIAGLVLCTASALPWLLRIDLQYAPQIIDCFYLAGAALVIGLLNTFQSSFAASLQRNGVPLVAQFVGDLLGLGITIFLLHRGCGLWSLAIGLNVRVLPSLIINNLYALILFRATRARVRWSRDIFADYIQTTPAVLGAKMTGQLSDQLPAVLLTVLLGPTATVVYTVSLRMLQIVEQLSGQLITACSGAFSHLFATGKSEVSLNNVRDVFAIGFWLALVGCAVYVFTNGAFVALWMSPKHYAGTAFSAIAAVAMLMTIWNRWLETLLASSGGIAESAGVAICERLLRLPVIYILISTIGLVGVPAAWLVCSAIATPRYLGKLRQRFPAFPLDPAGTSGRGWIAIPTIFFAAHLTSIITPVTWLSLSATSAAFTLLIAIGGIMLLPRLHERLPLRRPRTSRVPM